MNRVYEIGCYVATSQVAVGLALLLAAAMSVTRGREESMSARKDGTWPLPRGMAAAGLWFIGIGISGLVIFWVSFYPARRA